MSVFAKGPSATTVDLAGIAEVMRGALYPWMNGHIKVFDPKRANATGYNPLTDEGGFPEAALVFDSGENGAIIQPIRSPTRAEVGSQPNAVLGIRFQVKRLPVEAGQSLRGGLRVQVVDGGNDDQLSRFTYALQETVDSSEAWGRIWDAVVVTGGR